MRPTIIMESFRHLCLSLIHLTPTLIYNLSHLFLSLTWWQKSNLDILNTQTPMLGDALKARAAELYVKIKFRAALLRRRVLKF